MVSLIQHLLSTDSVRGTRETVRNKTQTPLPSWGLLSREREPTINNKIKIYSKSKSGKGSEKIKWERESESIWAKCCNVSQGTREGASEKAAVEGWEGAGSRSHRKGLASGLENSLSSSLSRSGITAGCGPRCLETLGRSAQGTTRFWQCPCHSLPNPHPLSVLDCKPQCFHCVFTSDPSPWPSA